MNTTTIMILVALGFVILGAIVGPILGYRRRSKQLNSQPGSEYNHAVQTLDSRKKAQAGLKERQKHAENLNIHPLSINDHNRYLADWTTVQGKFVDQPRQATQEADLLITKVMQSRDYPVSDFEQQAECISAKYPALVGNYRTARGIVLKNQNNWANTEELRRAIIYYRSLFDELLKA